MVIFSGLEFIFRFFPAFLAVYYITPKKYREWALLFGSIVFYAVGEPYYVLLLLVAVWLNYFFAKKYIPAEIRAEEGNAGRIGW